MFNTEPNKYIEELKGSLIAKLRETVRQCQADILAHKLIRNGIDIEIGKAIIDGLPKESTDAMTEILGILERLNKHHATKIVLLSQALTNVQETPAEQLTKQTVGEATMMCEGPEQDRSRVELAYELGNAMMMLAEKCPTI